MNGMFGRLQDYYDLFGDRCLDQLHPTVTITDYEQLRLWLTDRLL